jgi:hypothetical protein
MIKTVSLKLIQKAGIHFVKLFDRKRKNRFKKPGACQGNELQPGNIWIITCGNSVCDLELSPWHGIILSSTIAACPLQNIIQN